MASTSKGSRRSAFANRDQHPAAAMLGKGDDTAAKPRASAKASGGGAKIKNVGLRVPFELYLEIRAAAGAADVSINDYCNDLLRKGMRA